MELRKSKHGSHEGSSCDLQMKLILEEPTIAVPVGDEFQAEIPPLTAECNGLHQVDKSFYSEPNSPEMELPIPIMWTHKYIRNHVCVNEIQVDSQAVEELETNRIPLPGTASKNWMPDESKHILLALYIFGKNFVPIENFLQNVKMGDIMSFYYGKFYRTDKHDRWSKTWKLEKETRSTILVRSIFKGWRHQELLSRLFHDIPAESRKMLLKDAWMYDQGEYSLKDYAFSLSNTVGMDKLVDAAGIGTVNLDLTSAALKPPNGNKTFSYHPGNPTGKPFSSLSSAEILELLRGRLGLRKSQRNDLFWDAVWPRLRARGWHSRIQSRPGRKKIYVFLLPGIKTFSRRAYVRGSHYFDSIDDVLHEVALDAKILDQELKTAAESRENLEEHDLEPELGQHDVDGFSGEKCSHNLQPQNVSNNMHDVISTAADASLIHHGQPEMRECLPREVRGEHWCFNDSGESSNNTSVNVKLKVHTTYSRRSKGKSNKLDSSNGVNEHKSKGTGAKCSIDNDQPDSAGEDRNCLDAVKKSSDSYACAIEVSSDSSVIEFDSRSSSFPECEDVVSQLGGSKNIPSSSSQAVSNSDRPSEDTITDRSLDVDLYEKKNKALTLFDLNFTYIPSDVGAEEPLSKYPVQNDGEQLVNESLLAFDKGKQTEPRNITEETCQDGNLDARREKPSMFSDLNLPLALEVEMGKPSRKNSVQNNDKQHVLDTSFASKSKKRSREQFRKDVLQNYDEQHVVGTFPLHQSKKRSKKLFWEDVVPESDKQNVGEAILPSMPTKSVAADNSDGGGGSNTEQPYAMRNKRRTIHICPSSLRALEALECNIPRKKRKGISKSEGKSNKYPWLTDGSTVGSSNLNDGSVKPKSTKHTQMKGESSSLDLNHIMDRQSQQTSTLRLEMDLTPTCAPRFAGEGKRWIGFKAVAGER